MIGCGTLPNALFCVSCCYHIRFSCSPSIWQIPSGDFQMLTQSGCFSTGCRGQSPGLRSASPPGVEGHQSRCASDPTLSSYFLNGFCLPASEAFGLVPVSVSRWLGSRVLSLRFMRPQKTQSHSQTHFMEALEGLPLLSTFQSLLMFNVYTINRCTSHVALCLSFDLSRPVYLSKERHVPIYSPINLYTCMIYVEFEM